MTFNFPDPSASPWTAPNGQVFIYNTQTGNWEHEYIGGGTDDTLESVTYRDEITDVNVTVGPIIHMSPDHELEAREASNTVSTDNPYTPSLTSMRELSSGYGDQGSMVYGAGKFITSYRGCGKSFWVSDNDGLDWTQHVVSDDGTKDNWDGVAKFLYENNEFLALTTKSFVDNHYILRSSDGEHWEYASSLPSSGGRNDQYMDMVSYNGSYYVVNKEFTEVLQSTDLVNWTTTLTRATPITRYGDSFREHPKFVEMSDGILVYFRGSRVDLDGKYQNDGVYFKQDKGSSTWNQITPNGDGPNNEIVYGRGLLVSGRRTYDFEYSVHPRGNDIKISTDAINWESVPYPVLNPDSPYVDERGYQDFIALNWDGEVFWNLGFVSSANNSTSVGAVILTSRDGRNWHGTTVISGSLIGNCVAKHDKIICQLSSGNTPKLKRINNFEVRDDNRSGLFYDDEPVALQSSLTTINNQIEQNTSDLSDKLPLNFTTLPSA